MCAWNVVEFEFDQRKMNRLRERRNVYQGSKLTCERGKWNKESNCSDPKLSWEKYRKMKMKKMDRVFTVCFSFLILIEKIGLVTWD